MSAPNGPARVMCDLAQRRLLIAFASLAAIARVPIIRLSRSLFTKSDSICSLRYVWWAARNGVLGMINWLRDIWDAVSTVAHGMWVTLRYWFRTYEPERGTFTHKFDYPERPVPVAARYRGFHRYDLTTCIACDQCAKACPVDCIYIGKERVTNGKGFKITGFTIDYSKCMFCALCVEPCPVDCIFMGASHDLSCYSRDGCIVDFSRLPVDVAWGRATLNPAAVAESKVIVEPVHGGPNQ